MTPSVNEEGVEQTEKNVNSENLPAVEDAAVGNKEGQPEEAEEKEPEEKVNVISMLLCSFYKVEVERYFTLNMLEVSSLGNAHDFTFFFALYPV